MITDVEHFFLCLLAICASSLESCLLRPLAHLLIKLFVFLVDKFLFFFKDFIYLFIYIYFRERGIKGEREGETSVSCLLQSLLGNWPATKACALTGNQTSNLLDCRPVLNPLSHTSQGELCKFFTCFAD